MTVIVHGLCGSARKERNFSVADVTGLALAGILRTLCVRIQPTTMSLHLGVNIDHVATLRQARYRTMHDSHQAEPSPLIAAVMAEAAGAHSITVHLRADRRHIQDHDVRLLRKSITTKLNLEMGNTPEILAIALEVRPHFVCMVPENREEVTTEGGLDVRGQIEALKPTVAALEANGTRVSMFIDPELDQVKASAELGASMIELHTGTFANTIGAARAAEVVKLKAAAELGHSLGLQINAGHGLTEKNLPDLFAVPYLHELNIGHHIVSRSIFLGLKGAVHEILAVMKNYNLR